MKELSQLKSEKIQQRIDWIKMHLDSHYESVSLLKENAGKFIDYNCTPLFAPRVIKYSRLPKSEKRYQFTMQNITRQINQLEIELSLLIEYGA